MEQQHGQDDKSRILNGDDAAEQQPVFDRQLQEAAEQLMSIDQCKTFREMDDSQLVGLPPVAAKLQDVDMADVEVRKEEPGDVEVRKEAPAPALGVDMSTGKRRRGRPPRIQGKAGLVPPPPPPPPPQRKNRNEEDVCFICFDGGSLVLCDRRGCPKAYHPACIKRDEAFFKSKAKWNCGWHICSSCQKASHYMCYTCTYSLCKGCTKDADYVCVRGNKGFCGTCMRTIMLVENISVGNKETVQVDFDDQTSWEYLFKVYWIILKEKLCLTVDELTKAKNPWKGEEVPRVKSSRKGAVILAPKGEFSGPPYHGYGEKVSCTDNCCGNVETNSKRRKLSDRLNFFSEESSVIMERVVVEKPTPLPQGTTWATKELLEFVAHMKNGDISVLTQFDVQALLLEYIKRNNLRDPGRKSQIVCDSRLINLFGKERVGHFEMLKLLEYHFLIKQKSPSNNSVTVEVTDDIVNQLEAAGIIDSQLKIGERRRKTRKKTEERTLQINPNPDEYAAIDVHNVNLLYLKRSLMENLMDDAGNFPEKVVGSFVRIRILGDQTQDMYRLVQVVGISKVEESYKVGTRTTDVMLEILNLDKKEVISIDGISSQEFSDDECRRLRQSIKRGLIKRLTVGEIQEKAMILQPVKVNDLLEAEIVRLNHLRDRANEKGHKKELRECVEKLELLKSPKERQRRLLEIPIVHTDPKMNPNYESEDDTGESDDRKQGDHFRKRNSNIGRRRSEVNSLIRGGDVLNDMGNRGQKNLDFSSEQSTTFYVDRDGTVRVHERLNENSHAMPRSESVSGVASVVLPPPLSAGREAFVNDAETEKLWHYKDPTGKVQGPFSLMQLRKWSTSGLFPRDLRVWRINEKQDDSILLTDVLVGRFHKEPALPHNDSSLPQEVTVVSSDTDKNRENELNQSNDATWSGSKGLDDSWKSMQNEVSVHHNGNQVIVRNNGWTALSSALTATVDVVINNDKQPQSSLQVWNTSEGCKPCADQPQMASSLASPSPGKPVDAPLFEARESRGEKIWSSENDNSCKTTEGQTSIGGRDEKHADGDCHLSQSSGQSWKPPPIDSSSSVWDSNCGFVSVAKPTETSDQKKEINFSDLPRPTPKQIHEDLKGLAADNKQSLSSSVPVANSGPSWSTASSLVIGGAHLPEVAGEWGGGYSSTPAKPPIEEWGSNLVSASSVNPNEGAGDYAATPTSGSGKHTHSSPTAISIDASSWQPIVPEPNEFCSLADESVSDLLAEVEAMESLAGLPSPTSKLICGKEFAHGSDNDCFSPVEGFSPALEPGKSDALSSTGDIQMPSQLTVAEEPIQVSHMHSQLTVTDVPLATSHMHSEMTVTDEPPQASHMLSESTVTDQPVDVPEKPSKSTLTDEPLKLLHPDVLDPQKSTSGHSSTSAEVEGVIKPCDVSVNQLKAGSDAHLPVSTVNKGEAGSNIRPPTPSTVTHWEAGPDIRHHAPSTTDATWGPSASQANAGLGTTKGNAANWGRGGTLQGNTSARETGHGTVQQHGNTSTNAWETGNGTDRQHGSTNFPSSAGNPGSWGSQPRYGGGRYTGSRNQRNYHYVRDSGYSRDRSSWNRQQFSSAGTGNGGGSFRPPHKNQRVCKFHESGYCKKGASCRYLHPS